MIVLRWSLARHDDDSQERALSDVSEFALPTVKSAVPGLHDLTVIN